MQGAMLVTGSCLKEPPSSTQSTPEESVLEAGVDAGCCQPQREAVCPASTFHVTGHSS